MADGLKENSGIASSGRTGGTGFLNQWGGKIALFFTYTHFSHDLTTGLLAALLPFIRQDLRLDYLQSSLLVSVFSVTAGFSQLLGGWVSDRINRKKAIALGIGGVGLSAVTIIFASSYYALLVILVAMGILAGFYHPSAVSAITNHFEEERRGRAMALHMVGGSLGFAIGPVLGAIIANAFNWHIAFLLLGLPALIATLLIFTQLKLPSSAEQPKETASIETTGKKPIGLWQVFRPAAAIIAVSIVMLLVTGPILSFLSLYLVDVHHLSAAAGSMWVTVVRLGGLVGSLVGGWLTDKWGRRKTIFLSLIIFGPVVFLLAKLPFGVALAIIFIIFGWLMSMRETTMQTFLMDSSPPQLRATVFGIYFGFGQQGSSVIQPVAGELMDMMGIVGVFNVIAYISIGMSALSVILALKKVKSAS